MKYTTKYGRNSGVMYTSLYEIVFLDVSCRITVLHFTMFMSERESNLLLLLWHDKYCRRRNHDHHFPSVALLHCNLSSAISASFSTVVPFSFKMLSSSFSLGLPLALFPITSFKVISLSTPLSLRT